MQTKLLQQVVIGNGVGGFLDEVNGLLLDGWRIVPGSYNITTVKVLAGPHDPSRFIDTEGCCWRQKLFVAIEREETYDPDAARHALESVESRSLPELARHYGH